MAGTAIEPIGDYPYSVGIHPETSWIGLKTEDLLTLNCTLNHPLYKEDAETLEMFVAGKDLESLTEHELAPWRCEAGTLTTEDSVLTRFGVRRLTVADKFARVCTKRSVHMEEGHLYWANGFLSHNQKNLVPG
jgi:hypothetical protein